MAHYAKVASVYLKSKAPIRQPGSFDTVLAETSAALNTLKGYGLDLVVLPEEIESVGMRIADAESVDKPGPLLQLYSRFARQEKCILAGSARTRRDGYVFNSIVFYGRSGELLGVYDKTFPGIGEIEQGLASGPGAVVVETDLGRIGGGICFDLNFEELRFQYRKLKPDIMCFSSLFHGGFMQAVWAYECRSFFVSALGFSGGGIIDPFGRQLAETDCYAEVGAVHAAIARINLDRAMFHLDYNFPKIPDIRRKYKDEVTIDIPANIGSAILYSNTDRLSAMDVIREFGIELIDDYFPRSIAANVKNRPSGEIQ